ncbi:MAG: hypothetical protein GX539_05210 [Candidatus Cloacimonetes bacterium]|jgi:hypothetical protein|nr:hypothetical protein [Candidatus Cloacimonadota bacterium]
MPKYRNAVAVTMIALSGAVAQPAAAQVSDCFRDVIGDCADAMDGQGWFTRWALGVFCSALLTGCAVS